MRFFDPDCGENVKAAVHMLALGVLTVMTAYNVVAFAKRREQHLAGNAILYGALIGFEVAQVRRHHRAINSGIYAESSQAACDHSEWRDLSVPPFGLPRT